MGNAQAFLGRGSFTFDNIVAFLSGPNWPGSTLAWSDSDLHYFASCFRAHTLSAGKEASLSELIKQN